MANYQQSFGNATYTVDDQLWSLFAQDDYRISQRMTVNLGIRYERQTFTDATLNFAPRVGFVFDTTGNGGVVLRGGFGIYHSQIVDNSAASYALGEPAGVFTYTATKGQVGFPTSVASAPLPAFPAGGTVPVRSLYVRPGTGCVRQSVCARGVVEWLSEPPAEPVLGAVDVQPGASICAGLAYES